MNDEFDQDLDVTKEITRAHIWRKPGEAVRNQALGLLIFVASVSLALLATAVTGEEMIGVAVGGVTLLTLVYLTSTR